MLDEWFEALPVMPGFDNETRVLLRGRAGFNHVSVVVSIEEGEYLMPSWVRSETPDLLEDIPNDWTHEFVVEERYGSLTIDCLCEYIWSEDLWAYKYKKRIKDLAKAICYVQAVTREDLEAEIAELYGDSIPAWLATRLAKALDLQSLLEEILEVELFRDGDPRHLVQELSREPVNSGSADAPRVRIRFHPWVLEEWERYGVGVERRLRVVLAGARQVTDVSEEHAAAGEMLFECGTFDQKVWGDLDAEMVNSDLGLLPNNPVIAVASGNHAMEMLVVLEYEPDEEELQLLMQVDGVRRVGVAEPYSLYGRMTASLLVPVEVERSRLEFAIERVMTFLH